MRGSANSVARGGRRMVLLWCTRACASWAWHRTTVAAAARGAGSYLVLVRYMSDSRVSGDQGW